MRSFRIVFLLFALPATLLWLAPGIHDALFYQRAAVSHGDWWRLWTGHWVHFSFSHLGWNLLVLLAAGCWLEYLQPGRLLRYTLVAAPLISLVLLEGEPAMETYGGLSGLATGVVVLLALAQLTRQRSDLVWWCAVLLLVAAKTAFDAVTTQPLFSQFEGMTVRSSVWAHAAGVGTALAYRLLQPAEMLLAKRGMVRPTPRIVISQ